MNERVRLVVHVLGMALALGCVVGCILAEIREWRARRRRDARKRDR